MQYKVTKQFENAKELPCAQFQELADAQFFIQTKLTNDADMNIRAIYRVHSKYDELVGEYGPGSVNAGSTSTGSSAGSSASSRPTPFSTAPKPPGSLPSWMTNKDDEEKKK